MTHNVWHDDCCSGNFDWCRDDLNRVWIHLRWFNWFCDDLDRVWNHLRWLNWRCDDLDRVWNHLRWLNWRCDDLDRVWNHLRRLNWRWTSDYVSVGKAVVNDRVWYWVKCECCVMKFLSATDSDLRYSRLLYTQSGCWTPRCCLGSP